MNGRMGRQKDKLPFYKRKGFLYPVLFFVFMFVAGAAYYAYSIYSFTTQISKAKSNTASKATEDWTGTGRVNIALFGVDSQPGDGPPRSDSIMILSIDPETKQASLFSVLRDTYYKIPGYGFRKINEAFALGGPELAIETISKFTDLKINYYVTTNFEGFAKIVDAVGGIALNVEKDMYWDDGQYTINLKKGYQRLDGKQALMYVRFRHDALADYTRTERQRNFLMTLAKELKSTNAILNLPDILKSIQNDIETDMSFNDMVKLGKLVNSLDLGSLQTVQLPPVYDSTGSKMALLETTRDGAWVIVPDVYETRLLVHKTLADGKIVVRTTDDQAPMVEETVQAEPAPTPTPPPPHQKGTATPPIPKDGTGEKPVPNEGTTKPGTSPDGSKTGSGTEATSGAGSGSQNGTGTPSSPNITPKTDGTTTPSTSTKTGSIN